MAARPHIGVLREKPLHAALKRWYAQAGDRFEEPVDGFVIDIVRDELLIEIQTGGFSPMKRKLAALLAGHVVRVVYPIAVEKWIVKVDERGAQISRRKSPKRGAAIDLFGQLVSFPDLIANPGLSIEVVLIREMEIRRFDADKAWRRKGWIIEERRLVEVVDRLVIDSVAGLMALLPDDLPERFTTSDLAQATRRTARLAQQMTYCLRRVGAIEAVGKQGNSIVYARS